MSKLKDQVYDRDHPVLRGQRLAFVEGTFLWALDQMLQGNKITRGGWNYAHFWGDRIDEDDVKATDWRLYEEHPPVWEPAQPSAEDLVAEAKKKQRAFVNELWDLLGEGKSYSTASNIEEAVSIWHERNSPPNPCREIIYGLPTTVMVNTDEEWERALKEQVEEFRKKYDPGYYTGDDGDEQPVFGAEKKLKCECGSEKAKVPGHSTWCPKYNREESE